MAAEYLKPVITKEDVEFFLRGSRQLYPLTFASPDERTIFEGTQVENFEGLSEADFKNRLFRATKTTNISDAIKRLISWGRFYTENPSYTPEDILSTPEKGVELPTQPASDMPADLASKVEAYDTSQAKEVTSTAEENVSRAIAEKQKIQQAKTAKEGVHTETPTVESKSPTPGVPSVQKESTVAPLASDQKATAQVTLSAIDEKAPQAIYLKYEGKVKDEKISPEELKKLEILANDAHKNPREFEAKIKKQMLESLPPEIRKEMPPKEYNEFANLLAADFTQKMLLLDPSNPDFYKSKIDPVAEAFQSLANPNREDFKNIVPDEGTRIAISAIAQEGVLNLAADADIAGVFLANALGGDINLVRRFYSSEAQTRLSVTKNEKEADIVFSPRTAKDYFIQQARMVSTFQRIVDPKLVEKVGREKINELANTIIFVKAGEAMASGTKSEFVELLNRPGYKLITDFRAISEVNSTVKRWAEDNMPMFNISPTGVISQVSDIAMASLQEGRLVMPVFSTGVPYLNSSVTVVRESGFAIEFAGQIGTKSFSYILGAQKVAATTEVAATTTAAAVAKSGTGILAKTAAKVAATRAAIGTAVAGVSTKLGGALAVAAGILTGGWGLVLAIGSAIFRPVVRFIRKRPWLLILPVATVTVAVAPATVAPIVLIGGTLVVLGGFALSYGIGFFAPVIISLLIVLVGIPIVTILTVLIINSGAYVVPPAGTGTGSPEPENEFVSVVKTPNPSGPFENDQEITVQYTVVITAKKSELTQISFSDECSVYSEEPKTCPPLKNIISGGAPVNSIQENVPASIAPGVPYTITFIMVFPAGDYNDSAILNSFTINATVEGKTTTETGSATIIIGEPPLDCFEIDNNFPARYKDMVYKAFAHLKQDHPNFLIKVCLAAKHLKVTYFNTSDAGAWGKFYDNTLALGFGGLGKESDAILILTHEAAHALSYFASNYLTQFVNYPGINWDYEICTYDNTFGSPEESFAETLGLFASENYISDCIKAPGNFQKFYPDYYKFAKEVIFEQ